jgi:hypothetical protein
VLQTPGDLGLDEEAGAAGRVVGVAHLDLLQSHLAVQLGVLGHEHLSQPTAVVEPQGAEPHAGLVE